MIWEKTWEKTNCRKSTTTLFTCLIQVIATKLVGHWVQVDIWKEMLLIGGT